MEFGNGSMVTQTHELCLLRRQRGLRVRASLGTTFRIQWLLCCSSKQHAGQSEDPVCTMCRDKTAIRDSTSALLEHIMLRGMRMAICIASYPRLIFAHFTSNFERPKKKKKQRPKAVFLPIKRNAVRKKCPSHRKAK